jgi:predicted porin
LFKKMLLTLSVLTLLMGGVANAADADWTFYGAGHVSINSLSNGEDSQLGLTSNTSRFGFKGTAPINDDFSAFWQFESVLDMAGNEGSDGTYIGTRNTYVGFKHGTAGKFMFGRHDTPFKTLGRKVEMFPDQLGDFRSMTQGWENRLTELAAWVSPDWQGFSIFAAYQFDQAEVLEPTKADWEAKTAMSVMAAYTTEQFMLGAAYEAQSSGYGAVNDNDDYSDGPKAFRFAAKYMAEQFEIGGLFQSTTIQGLDPADEDDIAFMDHKTMTLGGGATFHVNDEWNVKGAMFLVDQNTDAEDDALTTTVDESDTMATQLAFGIERVFTKNVLAYVQFAAIANGDMTNVALAGSKSGFNNAVSGGIHGTYDTAGELQDPSGFSVGTVITW